MFRARTLLWTVLLSFAAATVHPAWADDEGQEPVETPAVKELKKEQELVDGNVERPKVDPYAVPNGSPKLLVGFITKLISGPPPRDAETLKKLRKAILEAAEKILAAKPGPQELHFAVQAKMNMLDTPEQLAGFIVELKKGGHEKAARMVRGFRLQIELRKSMMSGNKDVKKPIEEAVQFLEEAPPQISDLTLAYTAGTLAENSGDHALAGATYGKLAKIFASSGDARLADFTHILEGVVRRLDLVGHEMKLEGKFLNGESLDWPSYLGKVVLVVFWSTEYPQCLREVPDWKACYEQYHAKGFEIVGISLDRDNNKLEDFVKTQSIPWPNVASDGKPNPNMIYYGVTNLPTTMLVGKDGKVLAMDLRGEELKKQLQKLLGPPEATTKKAPSKENP